MSVKSQYKAHKNSLENEIKIAIAKFESNTGCLVISISDDTILHKHFNVVDKVYRTIIIKTNIDGDSE